MTTYHSGRILAILVGIAATVGALAILLADPVTTGKWRLDHFLLPLIVTITIASGHIFGKALRGWKLLSAMGFALIFTVGTLLTVYSSVGAQKSGAGARQEVAVVDHNTTIAQKRDELARARQRFDEANAMADREMTGERCGRRCNDWKLRAKEVAAHISQIERDLKGLGAPKVTPSKARPFADAMGVLGFNRDKIEKIASVFEPFAFSLLFELTAIVAFGFGFGGRPARKPVPVPSAPPAPAPPTSGGQRTQQTVDELLLRYVGSGIDQKEIAAQTGLGTATVSRHAKDLEAAGAIRRERVGKSNILVKA